MPPLSYFFWFAMFAWLIFGPVYGFITETPNRRIVAGGNLLIFILFVLIGLQIFWTAR